MNGATGYAIITYIIVVISNYIIHE